MHDAAGEGAGSELRCTEQTVGGRARAVALGADLRGAACRIALERALERRAAAREIVECRDRLDQAARIEVGEIGDESAERARCALGLLGRISAYRSHGCAR